MRIHERKFISDVNKGFADYISRRFNIMPSFKQIEIGMEVSIRGLEWKFAGTYYKAGFYLNSNGSSKFFIKLEFKEKRDLGKIIANDSHSGNKIEKLSKFLARPRRVYKDDSYLALCRLKKKPQKEDALYDNIWGYLIIKPLTAIHPRLA